MSLLTVVRDVCSVVGVVSPTSVFSTLATNRTMQEMLALANEMAQRIAYDHREWTFLTKQATLTGDGVKTAFDLPADFKRMLMSGNVWLSTASDTPMRFVPNSDEWMHRRARNNSDGRGEWMMMGGQIHVWPAMAAGAIATFPYLSKNCVRLFAGGFGDEFVTDGDTFVLGDRLLKLGMTWQWKAQKGSPYTEDLSSYGDALLMAMGNDKPSPIIIGRQPISVAARVAYPWPVPT